ncbi:MAG: ECF transporter S component [Clostridiales bacterium]|nr:ECF transporter S component [Clostridiales bacterium]
MKNTRQMAMDALLVALCAVLGYISLDMGFIKVTFESLPILLGGLLFEPMDGFIIGALGTLIYQVLRYGVTATTVLWMLPYMICGGIVGIYAKSHNFRLRRKQIMFLVIANELLITALNTGVIFIDSKIYGYYSVVYVFGSLALRLVVCVIKAVAFGVVLPGIAKAVRHSLGLWKGTEEVS